MSGLRHSGESPAPACGDLGRGVVICSGAALALGFASAAAISVSASESDARAVLKFDPSHRPGALSDVMATAIQNGRLAAGVLLAAGVVGRVPSVRRVLDSLLAGLLAVNSGAVGVALGAYGPPLLPSLAPHLPLELGAFSLAGGAYLAARRRALSAGVLARCAAACAVLLALAAFVESYLRLGAAQ